MGVFWENFEIINTKTASCFMRQPNAARLTKNPLASFRKCDKSVEVHGIF